MKEGDCPVHGINVTGGSLPAEIWQKFMSTATANLNDEFIELTSEQLEAGEIINGDQLLTPDETTTTMPPVVTLPTLPQIPGTGKPGGGRQTTTTTSPVGTTPTTDPSSTSSSTETTLLPGPGP
jgi:membrane peptidoglycan carboxypeptidase